MDLFERVMELRKEHSSETPYAVFDADNTIWDGDIAQAVLGYRAQHNISNAQKDSEHYYSLLDSGDMRGAYRFGASTLQGSSTKEIEYIAQRVLADKSTSVVLNKNVVTLMQRLRACGVSIWVVSASPEILVNFAVKHFDLDANVIGVRSISNIIAEARIISAELEEPLSIFDGKVACIKERISPSVRPLLGVGDSMNDLLMLEYAHLPAVRDCGNALALKAREKGWPLL